MHEDSAGVEVAQIGDYQVTSGNVERQVLHLLMECDQTHTVSGHDRYAQNSIRRLSWKPHRLRHTKALPLSIDP